MEPEKGPRTRWDDSSFLLALLAYNKKGSTGNG